MGFFWQGLPPYFVEWSQSFLPEPRTSVETGTFQGDTSELLARSFGSCATIERSSSLAAAAKARFASDPRITVVQGSSRDVLKEMLPPENVSAFFWLDAHGIYDYDGPDDQENPLLDELELIIHARGKSANVIAVDDARGMGVQPDWPPLAKVLSLLEESGFEVAIIDDTLVAVSASLQPDFYSLYKLSRIVEVSAVFHIWPRVMKTARRRARLDALAEKLNRYRRN